MGYIGGPLLHGFMPRSLLFHAMLNWTCSNTCIENMHFLLCHVSQYQKADNESYEFFHVYINVFYHLLKLCNTETVLNERSNHQVDKNYSS